MNDVPPRNQILKTPREWERIYNLIIMDADGWRGKNGRSFDDPINEDEWSERMLVSTIMASADAQQRVVQIVEAERPEDDITVYPTYHEILDLLCKEFHIPGMVSLWSAIEYIKQGYKK